MVMGRFAVHYCLLNTFRTGADIVSRDAKGNLFFYPAKGGYFAKKTQIATSW